MCFKKKPSPIIDLFPTKRRVLSFTIDDYPGSVNDLRGCNNDGRQVKETVLNYWPDFDVRRFMDAEAKLNTFKTIVPDAISLLSPGSTVLILVDSCFSGTITKFADMWLVKDPHPTRNRFYPQPGVPIFRRQVKKFLTRSDLKWIVISGCGETEYSADAWINGAYHGAFTWFAMITLKPGMTYREWYAEIKKYLPSSKYVQAPTIEGPDYLLDRKVFEDETLVIHNSSHGTQLPGIAEEPIDEAICFYDGNLRDNDYGAILSKIVV